MDAIDSLQPPIRDYSKPLLLPICDVIKSQSQGQLSVGGKVENGALRSGYKVNIHASFQFVTYKRKFINRFYTIFTIVLEISRDENNFFFLGS